MNEESIFASAVIIADADNRAKFVRKACGRDARLAARVDQLLKLHDRIGSFLKPTVDVAARPTGPIAVGTVDNLRPVRSDQIWLSVLTPSDEPGALGRMGQYDILSLVGRGGMGVVYRARQRSLRRIVALKMIRDPAFSTPDAVRRLRNEAEAAARLQHKNIVRIHEFGEFQGLHYYSMEHVNGRTLEELAGGQPLPSERAARYVETIASAIHYAHGQRVLHRDLKPANVLIDSADCVRIADFGLAKQMDVQGAVTEKGQIMGTAEYMSPEQAAARHSAVGPATDVYGIGAILYELLTGRAPFQGETPWEVLRRVCEQEPVPPRQLNTRTPKDLESICLRCLQKDPRQRYDSAGDLARDLRRFRTGQPVLARPIGRLHRSGRWLVRNRLTASLSMAILLLGCVVISLVPWTGTAKVVGEPHVAEIPPQAIADDGEEQGEAPVPPVPGDEGNPPKPPMPVDAQLPQVVLPPQPVPPEIDDPLFWVRPRQAPESPPASVTGRALAGEPFGVGEVVIQFAPDSRPTLKPDDPVWITDTKQRVLYPAVEAARDDQHRVGQVTIRFLFQGPGDLNLVATAAGDHPLTVKPVLGGDADALLQQWWTIYSHPREEFVGQLAGHDMLRSYLATMLSRRLNLTLPDNASHATNRLNSLTGEENFLHLLLGTASMRVALQKEVLLNVAGNHQRADRPLPRPLAPPAVTIPKFTPSPVEPLAAHVPQECFYVRCQSLSDWQWFRGALAAWGGNLNQLVVQRGLDQGIEHRLEKQLALNSETAAELFANEAIAEFALIGSDTFYLEGAAFGVLLRANDGATLQAVIERQRRSAVRVTPHVRETTEEIAGHAVSFLSTPDNSVRSFHAVEGEVHFVTTSRRLVERFFEAGRGRESLRQLPAFQFARSKFPLTRDDPVFIYLSDPFFAKVLSPWYRIEMTRRARALADLELVQMARWAAIAEHKPNETVADLVAAGLLPASIQSRPDGSQVLLSGGVPLDSLRGAAGTFTPILDMTAGEATAGECDAYNRFAAAYARLWARMDPVTIALNRRSTEPGREQIVCDVSIMPVPESLYGMAIWYLLPTKDAVPPPQGSLLQLSATLNLRAFGLPLDLPIRAFLGTGDLSADPVVLMRSGRMELIPELQGALSGNAYLRVPLLYGGIDDVEPLLEAFRGFHTPLTDSLAAITEPQLGISSAPDLPLWLQFQNSRLVLATRRDALAQVAPLLQTLQTQRSAQLRLTLADLAGTHLGELARTVLYCQARHMSAASPRLLHELQQQLHLEDDEARPLAEELLRGRLVCPMGGEYRQLSIPGRGSRWVSTAWRQADLVDEDSVPRTYTAPFLDWFHGLSVETSVTATTLSVHFELSTHPESASLPAARAAEEAAARRALARVLEELTAEARQAAFADWVRRFQSTDLVVRAPNTLPELWQQREAAASSRLAALAEPVDKAERMMIVMDLLTQQRMDFARGRLVNLAEPVDEAELARIMTDFPLTAAARQIPALLRERQAAAEWARLAPLLPKDSDRSRLLQEFKAKHLGTNAGRKANLDSCVKEMVEEDQAAGKLKAIRDRVQGGYPPQEVLSLADEFPDIKTAAEARNWWRESNERAVLDLSGTNVPLRAAALQFLADSDFAGDAYVDPLITIMLHEPRADSRRNAARIVNRLPEPAWDRAANALKTALRNPRDNFCGEAQDVLRVTRTTKIKSTK